MIGTILTPSALWKNFTIGEVSVANLKQTKNGDCITTQLNIEGRKVKDEIVNIYAELNRKDKAQFYPAILLVKDFSITQDTSLIKELVSLGYAVMRVDLAGAREGAENFTVYPDSVSYANFENAKELLYTVEKDAQKTCWYEWTAVIRYALKYLKSLPFITKVGGIGVGSVATALWQAAGTDENLDCAVFALNSGWLGYRGVNKFSGVAEPQFSEDMFKFIAGVDCQSYAMHVHCPTLMLSATNSSEFDLDRAYDTLTKIPLSTFSAIHYSVGSIDRLSHQAYDNTLIFLKKFLFDQDEELLQEVEIKLDVQEKELIIEASVGEDKSKTISSVQVYVAEEKVNPALRTWVKIDAKKFKDGVYVAKYVPYYNSGVLTAFVTATDNNGFAISSNVLARRFSEGELGKIYKNTLLYSSRIPNAQSIFTPAITKQNDGMIFEKTGVFVKKGPMGIFGVGCNKGLLTFALSSQKYMPNNSAILMLDVYAKQQAVLEVKLIADYFSAKTEYVAKVNLVGGDFWSNVQIEMKRFKTAEGIVLKDYSKISALEINVDGVDYLINNALWI